MCWRSLESTAVSARPSVSRPIRHPSVPLASLGQRGATVELAARVVDRECSAAAVDRFGPRQHRDLDASTRSRLSRL